MSPPTIFEGSFAMTGHARTRMQQRGIRRDALEALLDLGRSRHLHSAPRARLLRQEGAQALSQHLCRGRGRNRHHRWPPLPAGERSLAMPLDLLVALSPFVLMFVLWVLED